MEYVSSDMKLLPYGMMNFEDIRLDNYYYVDKTSFIPLIERSDRYFFFIRPRRFGKSLTLNMLQHYYDVRTRDKFDALFGDLYIGSILQMTAIVTWCCISTFPALTANCTITAADWMHIVALLLKTSARYMLNICPKIH